MGMETRLQDHKASGQGPRWLVMVSCATCAAARAVLNLVNLIIITIIIALHN